MAALSAGALIGCVGASSAVAAPELAVLGQGPVAVNAVQGKDSAEAYVTVLNAGLQPASISASFQAASSGATKATLAAPTTIQAGQATRVKLEFTGLKALSEAVSGELVINGGAKPVAQSVEVMPALQPSASWPALIVGVSLGLALLLIAIVALSVGRIKGWQRLGEPAPPPQWSFESWATHLTAVGAVLGTVLGSASLPATPRQIDKTSLVSLSLLFGALVVVAPFVFQAIQSPRASKPAGGDERSGYTWVLLLSCALTLGAVLGELATLGLAAWEITGGNKGGLAIESALGLLAALALYYLLVTAWKAASTNWEEELEKRAEASSATTQQLVHDASTRLHVGGDVVGSVVVVQEPPRADAAWTLP
ncbi:MAG TPA: hypothetical protein VGG08_03080 [Solirubrobacteraceae bacterium]|jgi:hypothetical protein